MKSLFFLLFLLFCFTSCKKNTERVFLFNPKTTKKYSINLESNRFKLNNQATCNFKKISDKVEMTLKVTDIEYKSDLNPEENNSNSQDLTDNTFTTLFDKYGNVATNDHTTPPRRLINPELLVIQFPKNKMKVGNIWYNKKSALPDLIFKVINVRYECTKISSEGCTVNVEMVFKNKVENDDIINSMTKVYKGTYFVKNDGVVKNATLQISGFSGFSTISGTLKIREIE